MLIIGMNDLYTICFYLLGIYYLSFSKSIGRYSFIYRNSTVKVPITEPIKPPIKLNNKPDLVVVSSSLSALSKSVLSTTFKRLLVVGC